VAQTIPAGDHDAFLGAIRRVVVGTGEPLVHFRGQYRDLRQL
jgi:flavin reductase (DIM6/NTAB) family NADH-FMN oxidoreductase RutF